MSNLAKNLRLLVIFVFGATYIFAPLRGWLDTSTTYVIYAEDSTTPEATPEPVVIESTPEPTVEPTAEPISESKAEQIAEWKQYVKTIFGKDAKIALAVSACECNTARPEWPNCVNSWEKEHSIGPWQINIAQNGGTGRKVHWDKIPGQTLEDKQVWLADPFNNTLIAFKIFKDSGWQPWTGYTSGCYLTK